MKSETEIRDRILYWGEIREGILDGEGSKRIIKHLIEELKWVIDDEHETGSEDNYYALFEIDGRIIEIDCRPSDIFATAVGVETPISVINNIFNKTSTSTKEFRGKILVVDDEERCLNFVSCLLAGEGYEVNTAVDGIDALAKIKTNRYNLLLTGICMPYMNGFELYKYVKRIDPSLANKTIVISGSINDENTSEFLAENKLTYVAKPFDVKVLKNVINHSLT